MDKNENKIYDIVTRLKALEEDIIENETIDTGRGYRLLQKKIQKQSRKRLVLSLFNKAAAILIIPLLLSSLSLLYLYMNKTDEEIDTQKVTIMEVTASPGSILKMQLPDDSDVWLNSGSTLKFPSRFIADKRQVQLMGEAFFRVEADDEFPFEVEVPSGMKVLARGTSFNVNAYPEDKLYETTLQSGRIEVTVKDKKVEVLPDEMVIYDIQGASFRKSVVNVSEKTGWKDGLLIFRQTPLEEVFKRLSRRYNVEFNIQNESTVDYGIRATFSNETITQILDALKLAAPITWSVKNMEKQNDDTYSRQQIDVWIR